MERSLAGCNVNIFMNDGQGAFYSAWALVAPQGSVLATTGDINGDGKPDLVFAGQPGLSVVVNQGDGTFNGLMTYPGAIPRS